MTQTRLKSGNPDFLAGKVDPIEAILRLTDGRGVDVE